MPSGVKTSYLHDLVERLAFDAFDGALEVDVSFAGVAEAGSGSDADIQRLAVRTPVWEACAVAEDDARGDLLKAWIVCRVNRIGAVCGPVVGEGSVEIEFALVDEFEHRIGEDGLRERGGREAGVVGYGNVGDGIDGSEAAEPSGAAIFNESDGDAGNVCLLHEARDVASE